MQTNKQKQQTTAGTFLLGTTEVLGDIHDVYHIRYTFFLEKQTEFGVYQY